MCTLHFTTATKAKTTTTTIHSLGKVNFIGFSTSEITFLVRITKQFTVLKVNVQDNSLYEEKNYSSTNSNSSSCSYTTTFYNAFITAVFIACMPCYSFKLLSKWMYQERSVRQMGESVYVNDFLCVYGLKTAAFC